MRSKLVLTAVFLLVLLLIPAAVTADGEIETGIIPWWGCIIGGETSNFSYYVYYPDKDKLILKCNVEGITDPPSEKQVELFEVTPPFCRLFTEVAGFMCTEGGNETVWPSGKGSVIYYFYRP